MIKKSEELDLFLQNLKFEINEVLFQNENRFSDISKEKKQAFLKALDTVVELKMQIEIVEQKFSELQEVAVAIATGDFSKRVDIPQAKDLFATFGIMLNMMAEDLPDHVVKKHYLEEILEIFPDAAIITDSKGIVQFVNEPVSGFLNQSAKDIFLLDIANIFEVKKRFGADIRSVKGKVDIHTVLTPYNSPSFPAHITIRELTNREGICDGYLYILKRL